LFSWFNCAGGNDHDLTAEDCEAAVLLALRGRLVDACACAVVDQIRVNVNGVITIGKGEGIFLCRRGRFRWMANGIAIRATARGILAKDVAFVHASAAEGTVEAARGRCITDEDVIWCGPV